MVKFSCTRRTKACATFSSLSPPSSKDMRMSPSKRGVSSSETGSFPPLGRSFRKRLHAALVGVFSAGTISLPPSKLSSRHRVHVAVEMVG